MADDVPEKWRCNCTCQMCQDSGVHYRVWFLEVCHGLAELDWKERDPAWREQP